MGHDLRPQGRRQHGLAASPGPEPGPALGQRQRLPHPQRLQTATAPGCGRLRRQSHPVTQLPSRGRF